MVNPECKLCGDDCSPSLSNRGWCIYCEKAYKIGKKEVFDDIDKFHKQYDFWMDNSKVDIAYKKLKKKHLQPK